MDAFKSMVEWVARPLKLLFDYAHNFNETVKKLKTGKERVEMERTQLQPEIGDAELRQLQQNDEDDVRFTKSKADKMLQHAESMEKRMEYCPNPIWRQQYLSSKELEEETLPEISGLPEMAEFGQANLLPSPSLRTFKYSIFLSFNRDSRKGFTGHLYNALTQQDIKTFRDDKSLETGEDFAPELLRAISESWGSIIVISEGYALSPWCLIELVEIMKQRKERRHRVHPIFYRTEPADFRHKKKSIKIAFDKHEERYDKATTQGWQLALKEVANINGWHFKEQYEADFIEGIVNDISKKINAEILDGKEVDATAIPTIFSLSDDFVDSKSSKAASDQIMAVLQDENVSLIALWGMGGVGKTTLVCQVGNYAKKMGLFAKVAIATVSRTPDSQAIRNEIAKYLGFDTKAQQVSKEELWSRLKEERILIILDDVWKRINLKDDIGIPFGKNHKGCKILLTTRRHQVCTIMDCQEPIQLGCLDEGEAWALFQRKADLENNDDSIMKVAAEVVKKCQGLPISIVSLGFALKGKTLPRWQVAYRRLKTRRLMDIEDINDENAYLCLEVSFDYLPDRETKMCFLLCSLFPEDYDIDVEYLVRYAWGLGLYKGIIDSIEEARSEVHAAMGILKDSSLLLDCGEMHVKMHDTVRDVALWIASYGKDIAFVIKSGVVETWPKNECFDSCTAISFINSPIAELPDGLVCPNLRILLLGGHRWPLGGRTEGSFFEGMKTLQVCSLHHRRISPDAFQFRMKLRTLVLNHCSFSDISLLGKLKDLEVLSLTESHGFNELPDEIGDLSHLRLLDLSECDDLHRIPPNLLRRLSKLEELYLIGCDLDRWAPDDEYTTQGGYASLSELNSLSKLISLSLEVDPDEIPKDFVFPKLQRFDICVRNTESRRLYRRYGIEENNRRWRSLRIEASKIDAFHFQQLIGGAEYLNLVGCENLVRGLGLESTSKLIHLYLKRFNDMKCLIDTSRKTEALTTALAFPNLVELSLYDMDGLEELWHGLLPQGFLQNLEKLVVDNCDKMEVLFEPNLRSIQGTHELRNIQQVNFYGLKEFTVHGCNKLTYLFPSSIAKSLGQLEELDISDCLGLKEIIQNTEASNVSLQSLRRVTVKGRHNLTSLSSLSHGQMLENLTVLYIENCSGLEYTFPFSMVEGLPKLKDVRLRNLPQLKGRDGNDILLALPSLQQLQVTDCPQLPISNFTTSSKIQKLDFGRVIHSEELFDDRYDSSSLKELELKELPELRVIWKDPILQLVNFQNLTCLKVSECKRLEYVFPPTIAGNLPQLKELRIADCEEMEQIIAKEETSSQHQDLHLHPICFPNLTEINIRRCENLKSLFLVSTAAHGLPKLEILEIEDNSKFKQVFEVGDHPAYVSMADGGEVIIKLPQLQNLRLVKLPNFVSFSPLGYHFIFPSLKKLEVTDCPNVTTRFSVEASERCGHAKTEASHSIYDNVMEESAAAQETMWPVGSDIDWPSFESDDELYESDDELSESSNLLNILNLRMIDQVISNAHDEEDEHS